MMQGVNFRIGSGFSITTGPSANIIYFNQDASLKTMLLHRTGLAGSN